MQASQFSKKIIEWYADNKRELPWRESNDPYLIWLSEIILQQTRVEQGLPYFYRFLEAFPDVTKFANAHESEILKLWQGLGYYSRARNMHHAAQTVVKDFKSQFPASYDELKKLKGIGDYTAAAIASFAFDLPHAVVDGNVYRFLSRHFGVSTPIDSSEGKKEFALLGNKLLSKKHPAIHNQAMMEIGALICKPRNPLCMQCPVNDSCVAIKKNLIDQLPLKSKKTIVKNRYFYYFLILYKDKFIVRKRTGNDIWKNLYDLPLIEMPASANPEKAIHKDDFKLLLNDSIFTVSKISESLTHKLSHQNLHTVFIKIVVTRNKIRLKDNMQFINTEYAGQLAFPKLIERYLIKENKLQL